MHVFGWLLCHYLWGWPSKSTVYNYVLFCFSLLNLLAQIDGTISNPKYAPCPAHFNIPPTASADYWLIVDFVDQLAATSRLRLWGIFVSLLLLYLTPGKCPTTRSRPGDPPLQSLTYLWCQLWVDCCVESSNGGHIRPRPYLSHYFF